jgi:hypothetical protein
VILRDKNGLDCEYIDNRNTRRMRENCDEINRRLAGAVIGLRVSDKELEADPRSRAVVLAGRKHQVRIFNESFERGGRFYRSWWQSISSGFRKFIEINGAIEFNAWKG